LRGGEHRRRFDLRRLFVICSLVLPKMMTATRTATPSAARRAHIVVEALFGVGAMFGLQKSISL
jgi:hypothetical protein